MATPRLHVPGPLAQGEIVELAPDQARQLRMVLRLRTGTDICLFDGSGVEASATLIRLESASGAAAVVGLTRPQREPQLRLTVAPALLKLAAFELAVQKLTELGVARIVPLATEHAVVSYRDARDWERRAIRLERILREAAEQSERVTLPELAPPMRLTELLEQHPVVALVERGAARPLQQVDLGADATLAIGPEGGWSPAERGLLEQRAAALASLGGLILRAETAAIAAAAIALHRRESGEHTR